MQIHTRNAITPIQSSKLSVARGVRRWTIAMLAGLALLAVYVYFPQGDFQTATPTAQTTSSNTKSRLPQPRAARSALAVRPPTYKSTMPSRYSDADTALQNLWRICAEPNPADIKVTALDGYARGLFAAAGLAAKDSLERIADTAFDYDPAMARAAALSSSVPEIQLAAITNLARGTDVQAPATLALVATYPDVDIRRGAIEGLGQLLKNDPQVRVSLAYLKQTETDPDNAMLIEDWFIEDSNFVPALAPEGG